MAQSPAGFGWSPHIYQDCAIYSESTVNGQAWGRWVPSTSNPLPIQKMEVLPSTSMLSQRVVLRNTSCALVDPHVRVEEMAAKGLLLTVKAVGLVDKNIAA